MHIVKNIIILLFILATLTATLNRPSHDWDSIAIPDISSFIATDLGLTASPANLSRSNISNNDRWGSSSLFSVLIITSYGDPLTIKKTCSNPFADGRSKPVKIPHTLVSLGCKLTI
ncbi:MAG: hypothetical protein JW745_07025 [Sedimentisphaerales bacterium]|nr:hypothetical protein [Sedimentisphaerales bacterium]MBN2842128.1 hypothetical protein [Sedimentisphaerales bacterium]